MRKNIKANMFVRLSKVSEFGHMPGQISTIHNFFIFHPMGQCY